MFEICLHTSVNAAARHKVLLAATWCENLVVILILPICERRRGSF